MAAGRPVLAVVLLLACAAPLLLADDVVVAASSWCRRKECECTETERGGGRGGGGGEDNDRQQQVSVKCTFVDDKNVILVQDIPKQGKSLVTIELNGDGRSRLTVHNRTFEAFARLRSINVTGFADVTIKRFGLLAKNEDSDLTVTVSRVRRLELETNAVQPRAGRVDVAVEDCAAVRLNGEVISKLRSFAFRRIDNLTLSENTFKNAAEGSAIEKVILENLSADKLPSHAFITSIDLLSITNCTFGTIERYAFPVNSMVNVTLTNVTVDRVKSEAFRHSSLITNLRIIGCRVREMETNAAMSTVQSIHIERTRFGLVHTAAVAVANELTLRDNTFERVDSRGFTFRDLRSVHVDGNAFDRLGKQMFFEASTATRQSPSELRVRDNVFGQRPDDGPWWPAVQLQRFGVVSTEVTGNRFVGSCGCGPWRFVSVTDENGTEVDGDGGGDHGFVDRNYCRPDPVDAGCANLTTADRDYRIGEFVAAVDCDRNTDAYGLCVKNRAAIVTADGGGGFRFLGGAFTPATERGVITTIVMLILCGFGAVCAVSAVTWLNARGYFIKLRSLLTPNGSGGDGGGGGGRGRGRGRGRGMARTMSAYSLSPMPVHEYAELQKHKLGGSGDVRDGSDVAVRVIVYQDKGTQTVPEELTHEVLQTLRDKLDDPDDYAEARGMIEHLYDLIRVEETCCGSGWYSAGGGLDDMTSTITTKAITVGQQTGRDRDVRSVGTGAPSLDRLWPPKINMAAVNDHRRAPLQPPLPDRRPPSVVDYMDPVDLLYMNTALDDDTDADIYCELADLRIEDRPQLPPPVPNKPTEV